MFLKSALLATAIAVAISGPAYATYAEGEAAFSQGNYRRAYQELEAPANQGDPRAQFMLGRMFTEGRGVNQDYVRAHMWLNLATTGGVTNARGYLDNLGSQMTGQQTAQAQEMARNWKPTTGAAQAGTSQAKTIDYSVRNTQILLNRLGHPAGVEDGAMGGSTRSGISSYQRAKGIYPDGRLTQGLFDKIAVDAGYAGNAGAGTDAANVRANQSGATVNQVAEVQTQLRALDYDTGTVTGRMNAQTEAAIREYEADAGMRVTGRADAELLERLVADGKKSESRETHMVRRAQKRLDQLGYETGSADGKLDWRTRNAVRKFQADKGMAVDGQVDRELLDALHASVRDRSGPKAESGTADRATVMKIETALNRQGYNAGIEDGWADDRTQAAIRQYQQDWKLSANGQASTELLDHIQGKHGSADVTSPATITDIERELVARGYRVGAVDGRIDGELRNAVRTWQTDSRVTVNGELDETLLADIRASKVTRAQTTPNDAAGALIRGITDSILGNTTRQ